MPDITRILFQGDSITDAGRDRKRQQANASGSLGRGYAMLAAARLLADHPSRKLKVHNRGISGNKVPDLEARWEADCIELKPDLVSILIGVNDIWHKLNGRYDGTVAGYEEELHRLLDRTRSALPKVTLVLCDPFVLRCGAIDDKWFPEFDERRAAAARQAKVFDVLWVPFQEMFDELAKDGEPAYWAGDGVHPTLAGHQKMADAWVRVTREAMAG
ncbi:MAG: SGNH/GDSL hydrolase family protein [bacterium]|nr:SGNH/GDSL hydrolase family protein [bacterium]